MIVETNGILQFLSLPSFQLKIISDSETKRSTDALNFKDVTLTDFYVIIADNTESVSFFVNDENLFRCFHEFLQLDRSIKSISLSQSFNEEGKFLILLNNPNQREGGKHVAWKVLNTLFKSYRAVNVVVLYASDAFSYDIYTGDPYHGNIVECGKMKTLHIGKCAYGNFLDQKATEKHLAMNKVPSEMHQCTFNLCARVQEPFVNEGCQDGLEIQIMHILQEEMGFKINTTCSKLDRGELNEDGTWSDLLGEVRDDACDIIAGAFFPDQEVHAGWLDI